MNLAILDFIVIIISFALTFLVAISVKFKNNNDESYILAGRKLTTPLFVATLVATWYGSILGVGEFVNQYGVLAWICMGLPYYITALFFALFFADKIRVSNSISIPARFYEVYGKNAGIISSIIILLITLPSAYVLMLGLIVKDIFNLSLLTSIIISTTISYIYIYKAGFKSDVYSNVVQFILMYIGFIIFFIFLVINFGSPLTLLSNLDNKYVYPINNQNIYYIVVWFIISLQTFVDPSFFQRCAAAKTKNVAKKGVLYSILFWILFDFLTLFTGLYSILYFKIDNPVNTYLIMGDSVLPLIFKGIFLSSIIATVMSTLNSYGFISGITIGYDILKRLNINSKLIIKNYNKIGLVLSGAFSIIIAIYVPSIIEIFFKTSSLVVPSILIPLFLSYNSNYKIKENKIYYMLILPFCGSLITSFLNDGSLFTLYQPMFIGLIISIILTPLCFKKISQ